MTKIAFVSDDGKTIHRHFGRATQYVVVTVEEGKVVSTETRVKPTHHGGGHGHGHDHDHDHDHEHEHGHGAGNVQMHEDGEQQGHGFGAQAAQRHADMFAPIADCDVLISRGMGRGAFIGFQSIGVAPLITDLPTVEEATAAYIAGNIVNHTEKLH